MDGKRIAQLREAKKLSQEELADLLNVHVTTLSRWENGHFEPKASAIQKLCTALGVSEAELLSEQKEASWTLKIKINEDLEGVDISMGSCISDLNLTRKGAALTVGAEYAVFEDDTKFEDLISQLRAVRDMVIENGKRMAAINTPVTA